MKVVIALALLSVLSGGSARFTRGIEGDEDIDYHRNSDVTHQSPHRNNAAETTADYWQNKARDTILQKTETTRGVGADEVAKNLVMFLGDGMSVPTLAAARTLLGQRNGTTGEEASLSFENFPIAGLVKTYCVNAQVADSSCTGTAYLCGVKTNQGQLGVTANVTRGQCGAASDPVNQVASLAAWALQAGKSAGIVTTTRITHASPAAAYSFSSERNWESDYDISSECSATAGVQPDIADQLMNQFPGNQFKVILGGGRRAFVPYNETDDEGSSGRRRDGRNLINEWKAQREAEGASHEYVWNTATFEQAMQSPPEYLLGLFESGHMHYSLENNGDEPSLESLTEAAIRVLSHNEEGFFLFVEGGRIDHAHHANLAYYALDETIELSKAVGRADEMLSSEDSLLVVTADHAHVMAFNGYSARGSSIAGVNGQRDSDGVPYTTLSYTNGPGYRQQLNGVRPDVTLENDFGSPAWEAHVDVPLGSETHGGDDVAVFARGPRQHLFSGLFEQHVIPHAMAAAARLPSPALVDVDLEFVPGVEPVPGAALLTATSSSVLALITAALMLIRL